MQEQYEHTAAHRFFLSNNGSKSDPFFILLSGTPCVGKSTWREHLLSECFVLGIPVYIVSSDDIAFLIRDELNQRITDNPALTYTDICTKHRDIVEHRIKEAIGEARNKTGIIILDRTYLNKAARANILELIKGMPVHALYFKINDEPLWQSNFDKRNDSETDKKIPSTAVKMMTTNSSEPTTEEGFLSVTECLSIGEPDWERIAKETREQFISIYQEHIRKNKQETLEAAAAVI